jgi:hypothetical protein
MVRCIGRSKSPSFRADTAATRSAIPIAAMPEATRALAREASSDPRSVTIAEKGCRHGVLPAPVESLGAAGSESASSSALPSACFCNR